MKKPKIWINGRFVDTNDARVSVFDRGFLYGDGIFETMRSYAGIVFKLDAHLARLFTGLVAIKIKPPHPKKYIKAIIYKALKINGLKSAYIRITVTRGEGRLGIGYEDKFTPKIVVVAREFAGYPGWMHGRGISAKIAQVRQNEYSPVSRIKSINYLNNILARMDAKKEGYDEAILENTKGHIAEAATSNVFLVKRNAVITPSLASGVLPGVTRNVIIEIAKSLKLKLAEKRVLPRELLNSDEIFLTNSLAEILPVVRIGRKKIGDGLPGDVTKLFHISYQKKVIREAIF